MKAFVLSHLNSQLRGLTTEKSPEWCYCSPLLRHSPAFVQAALHFDSVIVCSGYANPPFHRSENI